MDRDQFRALLSEHMLPMMAGTELGNTLDSSAAHRLVAYEHLCSLLLKPSDSADFRLQLVRSQPFSPEEKRLVEFFVTEVSEVESMAGQPYFGALMAGIPRRVISKFLPGNRGRRTLEQAIQDFEAMASQTYEGRPVVGALGMTGSMGHGPIELEALWREDFSRVLSNGFDSMYLCGSDGRVFKVAYLPEASSVEFAPHRLGSIAGWCSKKQRVALVLNRSGEVLVFRDNKLQFAKRRGAWRYYAHESVVSRLGVGNPSLRRAVYETCLDVSFARTGGCVAVLSASSFGALSKVLADADRLGLASQTRTKLLKNTITKPFQQLDRRLRQELLSMDGATIVRHTGEVVAAGAIVRVPGGSTGGGRRAAAMQLSKLGMAVKVSADGPITGFKNRKQTFAL